MIELDALIGEGGALGAPKLGVFRASIARGALVRAGTVLGTLHVLNRVYRVRAPAGVAGVVEQLATARDVALGYRDTLLTLGKLEGLTAEVAGPAARAAGGVDGVAVVAPIAGIYYRRASPAAPPYVEVGQAVVTGQTVGLIEVMKTFNPVVYSGAPGTVVATPAGDRQEVSAGEALVVVRA